MQSESSVLWKKRLRSDFRARRQALSPAERQRLSQQAAGHVLSCQAWSTARCMAFYVAVQGETDTSSLLQAAWALGKTVLLPLCSREKQGEMRFVPCPGPEFLVPGYFGIPEPRFPAGQNADKDADKDAVKTPVPDLILVPGLAFALSGARLGQGGGYYDRLLGQKAYAKSLRLGFAYGFQVVEHLPEEEWDLPVQALATEEGIVWFKHM